MSLSQKQALELLSKHEFLYATTVTEIEFEVWHEDNYIIQTEVKPKGTRVIVTMLSRFGDVGIRMSNLEAKIPGYERIRADISNKNLSDDEKDMALCNKLSAIKSYKARNKVTLIEAKEVVDYFLLGIAVNK